MGPRPSGSGERFRPHPRRRRACARQRRFRWPERIQPPGFRARGHGGATGTVRWQRNRRWRWWHHGRDPGHAHVRKQSKSARFLPVVRAAIAIVRFCLDARRSAWTRFPLILAFSPKEKEQLPRRSNLRMSCANPAAVCWRAAGTMSPSPGGRGDASNASKCQSSLLTQRANWVD